MKKMTLLALCLTTSFAAAESQPVPATPARDSTRILGLTAPVGTVAEYVLTARTRLTLSTPTVEPLPGQQVDQQTLDDLRRNMQKGSPGDLPAQTIKMSYKVAARDARGTTLLVSMAVDNPQTRKPATVRMTQRIAPDGKADIVKVESDDPKLRAVFSALTTEMLKQMKGQEATNLYGRPLVPGQSQTQAVSVNMQSVMGSLLTALSSGPGGEKLTEQVRSTPLTAKVTTTYVGMNSQGQHHFRSSAQYQPWQVQMLGQGSVPRMNMELLSGDMNSVYLYRRDGLPSHANTDMKMKMRVTTEMEGVRVQVTMDMQQTTQLQAK